MYYWAGAWINDKVLPMVFNSVLTFRNTPNKIFKYIKFTDCRLFNLQKFAVGPISSWNEIGIRTKTFKNMYHDYNDIFIIVGFGSHVKQWVSHSDVVNCHYATMLNMFLLYFATVSTSTVSSYIVLDIYHNSCLSLL